jgi:alpha-L-rhamnosidase
MYKEGMVLNMQITHMKVNHVTNPIGFRLGDGVHFSWLTENANGKRQKAARIIISEYDTFSNPVYDSGKDENMNFFSHYVPIKLSPRTRYYWQVTVWTDNGEVTSPAAFFETAKEEEPWNALWIAATDINAHPVFEKEFICDGPIKQARAYASALGIFEMDINGSLCGDEYLLPGFHGYDNWLQYITFDLTGHIKKGDNKIAAHVGNGWYKSRLMYPYPYGKQIAFICEIHIEYENGKKEIITTDKTWQWKYSATYASGIYEGEFIDANICKNAVLSPVLLYHPENAGPLSARLSPPIQITDEIKPIEIINTPKGETVIDFGQIMTGWVKFDTSPLPEGTKIFMQYGEILQDDCFFRDNLRTAKAEFSYISDGQARVARPRFTFYGFRYVKVEDWPGEIDPGIFTGCVIMSGIPRTGFIETANSKVNQLIENIIWGQKGNFLDVPTDCPQRDERLGWTGDAQAFGGTACFNMDSAAFFHKYLVDMRGEQPHYDGSIPYVVPCPKELGNDEIMRQHGSAAWADAATILPWTLYLHYGDKQMLHTHYPLMKDFTDWMIRRDETDGDTKLCRVGFHYADWLALDNLLEPGVFGETDPYYIASAYYFYSTSLTARAACALGKTEDAAYYARRADEIRKAIQKEYFTETGRCVINTQTAYAVALFMGLLPETFVSRNAQDLKKRLERRKNHLETGFVGTTYLSRVLSNNGLNHEAYTLLLNESCPSWLYEVNMGATTVWERWNSVLPNGKLSDINMNSLNHYAYGSVGEWLYRDVCGLNPTEDAPGFAKTVIAPKPDRRLPWVKMRCLTAAGEYEINWKYDNECWELDICIPFGCEAELVIPEGMKMVEGDSSGRFESGKYCFRCK